MTIKINKVVGVVIVKVVGIIHHSHGWKPYAIVDELHNLVHNLVPFIGSILLFT